jgi:CubicO group peptidase (beta-lactamase class C family)
MKKLLSVILLALITQHVETQGGVAGYWRAVSVVPDGTPDGALLQFTMDLMVEGASVTGTVEGAPLTLSGGRVEGTLVTLTGVHNDSKQALSLTGELSGSEIVFRAVGLSPEPIRLIARRVNRPQTVTGSVSDAALIQQLLKQTSVPGVSIAVIKDFKVAHVFAYGVADSETRAPVTTRTMFQAGSISKTVAAMASLKAVQEKRFRLDQDVNTILKSWKLPVGEFTRDGPVTPRTLMSHVSGTGDGFGFPGYTPGAPLPTLPQILDGLPPSNTRKVRLERAPMTAEEYSGGAVMVQQLALMDAVGKPFAQIAREWIFDPLEMTDSTFDQPLPAARHSQAAHAHGPTGTKPQTNEPWRVFPEQAAAGLWTTPTDLAKFAIDVQLALRGRPSRVLSPAVAREMITPVGVGNYGVGFAILKQGEGWYFMHNGSTFGFRASLFAHSTKGYGAAIMTNGAGGDTLIPQVLRLIQQEYKWDAVDLPLPRRYGPE